MAVNQASIGFATDLYRHLPKYGNLLISPTSIRSALGRAMIGANGKTRNQLEKALGLSGSNEKIADLPYGREQELSGIQGVVFDIENRIYAQQDYQFVQTDLDLMNGVYLKGDWLYRFNRDNTHPLPFYGPGSPATVPLMYQSGKFQYKDFKNFQVVRIPFTNERLGMVIILPRKGIALSRVEEEVYEGMELLYLFESLRRCEEQIELFVPRFEVEWGAKNLVDPLRGMGIVDAFENKADFTKMETTGILYISGVFHKAKGVVNEGAEMAAATGVMMRSKGIMNLPITFRADRSFLFALNDTETGELAFMGRYEGPNR